VHRCIDDHETLAAAVFHVKDPSNEQSGRRGEHPPRLERESEPQRTEDFAHKTSVARRLQRALGVVADADAAAEIDAADGKPNSSQIEDELGKPLKGTPVWLETDELRPDMHRKADRLDAG